MLYSRKHGAHFTPFSPASRCVNPTWLDKVSPDTRYLTRCGQRRTNEGEGSWQERTRRPCQWCWCQRYVHSPCGHSGSPTTVSQVGEAPHSDVRTCPPISPTTTVTHCMLPPPQRVAVHHVAVPPEDVVGDEVLNGTVLIHSCIHRSHYDYRPQIYCD